MENRSKFLIIPFWSLRNRLNALEVLKSIMIVILLLGTTVCATAQQIAVSGIVLDQSGQPVIGATVQVQGTTIGTLTDVDGKYSLPDVPVNGTLNFSFVGMAPQAIQVNNRSAINVTMSETAVGLDEIVVVGYGTQTKKTLTGAVSAMQSDDLTRTVTPTATAALVGKVAGITARISDARPGAGTSIMIRNYGTPLYIIDGVPRSANDFNMLEVENIENISILKDASAAIYGLQAENGVVLVTTKLGKINEKPTININGYYGLQGFTTFPQHSNSYYFVLGQAESAQNRNLPTTLTPDALEKYKQGYFNPETGEDYRSFDYYDYVIRQQSPAPQIYLSASASGSTDRVSYFFSLANLHQDAVIESYYFKRTSVQANLEAKLARGFKIGTQISGRVEFRHQAGVPGVDDYPNIFSSLLRNWPIERPYANDNPLYVNNTHSANINPATYVEEFTGYTNDRNWVSRNNFYAEYDFDFGLKARGTFAYGFSFNGLECFEYTYDVYTYNYINKTYDLVPGGGNKNAYLNKNRNTITDLFGQFQLSYNKKFGKSTLSAVGAYEQSKSDVKNLTVHIVPPNNYIPTLILSLVDRLTDTWNMSARASYIGRLNYNYDEKYLLEFVGRYDGSYMYAPGKRWGLFPGISIGWRISNEPFFSPLSNVFSELKFRASYGITGSETGVSPFGFLEGFDFQSGSLVIDGSTIVGIRPRGIPITELTWVQNKSTNIGIDVSLFNGKINGQLDVFERRRTGLPAARYDALIPSEVGYSLPNENLNSTTNRGVEGMIDFNTKIGPVSYTVGVNATLSRVKNLSSYKPRFGNSYDEYMTSTEDRWSGINWGYRVLGQFQSMEEIEDHPVNIDGQGNRSLLPGDLIYDDVNGDNIITTLDQVPIGYATGTNPYVSFGINNSFRFKRFNAILDFAGAAMQTFAPRQDRELVCPYAQNGASPQYLLEDRWHRADPFDPNSEWISGRFPPTRQGYASHSNFARKNDFYVININYLRLRNLEIGWEIPLNIIQRIGVQKLRIYANITNLFCFDNIRKVYELDPEVAATDGRVYPPSRVFNFGLNLTL